jgi:hypothetical protein
MTPNFLKAVKSLQQDTFDPRETMQWLTRNMNTWFSWGCSKRINVDGKALVLKVSGHHHKGYVVITLAFSDTYTVSLVSTTGTIKETIENVYCDQLVEVIDNKIERIKQYVR